MPIIAIDDKRYSSVVKHEHLPEKGYCKTMVTVNGAAGSIAIGTVLGKVTATGKYKVVQATATDGSEVAVAIVVGNQYGQPVTTVQAANTDTSYLVLHRGPAGVARGALVVGNTVTAGALTNAVYAQLADIGIDALVTI